MNNIILTSKGFCGDILHQKQYELFKEICKNKSILIIDNACATIEISSNFNNILEIKNNFINLSTSKVEVITLNKDNLNEIKDYDILYVLGGSINELLRLIQTTNFKQYLLDYLKSGGVYIGVSAGSIILCDNVEYDFIIKKGTHKRYDEYFENYDGLNIVKERIFPHYDKINSEIKEKVDNYNKVQLTTLRNGDYILKLYKTY